MRKGFTLIELMIVIAIIAIIAAIAIPNLLESRITANESQAGSNLKSGLLPAQVQFQAGGYVDEDADGIGIYAADHDWMAPGFVNAAAANLANGPLQNMNLALLDGKWQFPDGTAIGAYAYQVDVDPTAFAGGDEENFRERYWAGYTAPAVFGDGGRRLFAISSGGSIYANLQSVDYSVIAATSALGLAVISAEGTATGAYETDPCQTNAVNTAAAFVPYQK